MLGLDLVVHLRGHVKEDAQLRSHPQGVAQEVALLPSTLGVAIRLEASRHVVVHHLVQVARLGIVVEDGQLAGVRKAELVRVRVRDRVRVRVRLRLRGQGEAEAEAEG